MLLLLFQQATGAYAVTADVGVYALAGQDAGLVSIRIMPSDVGAYALSGQDAALTYGRVVVSDVGSYVLTGIDAGLVYSGGAQPSQPMAPISVGREKRAWAVDGYGSFAVKEPHSWAVLGAGQSEIALDSHVWRVPRVGGSS